METKQQLRERIKELEEQLAVYKSWNKRNQDWYEAYSKRRTEDFYRNRYDD